ncbi:hypothetical protein O181_019997 [Austropuccinia psidii MF-1]|uniref:Uncharacterized protein n=1 Tax=Austropuccinia psidii MF-1 TaxID=1389203 RepID=A0A9Q3GUY3_9BASI|nr:hypothetical protein [Austropuccinia psidii MF-1]
MEWVIPSVTCTSGYSSLSLGSGASCNPSRISQKGYRCDYGTRKLAKEGHGSANETQNDKLCHYGADKIVLPSKRAKNAPKILSGHSESQQGGIKQCTSTQRVSDLRRTLAKTHELLPECEKVFVPYQYFQVTEWMASIGVKEENDALNRRMEEKNSSSPKKVQTPTPVASSRNYNMKKQPKSQNKGKEKESTTKP